MNMPSSTLNSSQKSSLQDSSPTTGKGGGANSVPFNNVMLILTDGCNLRCSYCYEKDQAYKSTNRMSWPTAQRAIDQFLQQVPEHAERSTITFFGGEPTLEFDVIKKCIAYSFSHKTTGQYSGKGYNYVINTNGTILTEEMYQFYGRLGKRLNLRVSADGYGDGQDATRKQRNGRGSWALLKKNLTYYKNLKEKFGVDIYLISTINKSSFRDIYSNFTKLHEYTGMQLGCLFVHEDPWEKQDFELLKEQFLRLKDYSLHNRISMPLCRSGNTGTSQIIEDYRPICSAGYNSYTVTPQGNLFACHRCSYYNLGGDFWLGSLDSGFQQDSVKRIREINRVRQMPEKCWTCQPVIREKCHVCLASNKGAYGSYHRVSDDYCNFMNEIHTLVTEKEKQFTPSKSPAATE